MITFEEILPIWTYKLWPERRSEIKAMSSMVYLGGNDMEIYEKYVPTFFALSHEHDAQTEKIIGVNSGFKTDEDYYRSRGIWVDPNHRGEGLARKLFKFTEAQALKENCRYIWSIPRQSAWPAYQAFGFEQTSDWFDEGMEFGPNCYVRKTIKV